jgi:hypothetical protein
MSAAIGTSRATLSITRITPFNCSHVASAVASATCRAWRLYAVATASAAIICLIVSVEEVCSGILLTTTHHNWILRVPELFRACGEDVEIVSDTRSSLRKKVSRERKGDWGDA